MPKVSLTFANYVFDSYYGTRCTALPADIDAPSTARRHILTDALIDEFEHDHDGDTILWDEYGIDVDIVPFTRDFPRADIHELISSDLLHQAIKGTFKDHLVDWVDKYLEMNYDKAEADRRKDEIDKRCDLCFPNMI